MPLVTYSQWDGPGYARNSEVQRAWAEELLPQLNLKGHERVLDVGCGPGAVTHGIARQVPKGFVLGIDSATSMINFAQQTYQAENLEFQNSDIESFLSPHEFDLVVSFSCLHWVANQKQALRNVATALAPEGRFFLLMGARPFPINEIYNSVVVMQGWPVPPKRPTCFTLEEYRRFLQTADLRVERADKVMSYARYKDPEELLEWQREISPTKDEKFLREVCAEAFRVYPDGVIPMPRLIFEGGK